MKTALLVIALAGAAAALAAKPPLRIELDLAAAAVPPHDWSGVGYAHPGDGMTGASVHDYSQRCPAALTTDYANCPLPTIRTVNHNDQQVAASVTPTIVLVDRDSNATWAAANPSGETVAHVDFRYRATYLIKYNAVDNVGNAAEEIVFALFLDDTTKPTTASTCAASTTIEAASADHASLCWDDSASDNIDGSVTSTIRYVITSADGGVLLQDKTAAEAQAAFSASTAVSTYTVYWSAHDDAGKYGHGGSDNVADATPRQIMVRDRTPPQIHMHGGSAITLECCFKCGTGSTSVPYSDDTDGPGGADVVDAYDGTTNSSAVGTCATVALSNDDTQTKCFMHQSTVSFDVANTYSVTYTAHDTSGNVATQKVRTVTVQDTTPPTITLVGDGDASPDTMTYTSDNGDGGFVHPTDPGVTCTDACDQGSKTITKSWTDSNGDAVASFDPSQVGTYQLTYTCTDAAGKSASVTRTVIVADGSQPTVEVDGSETLTYEARVGCSDGGAVPADCYDEARDGGATCRDWHEGNLTDTFITVSGNQVDMAVPGSYVIQYDCTDSAGQDATTAVYRTVVVEDTTCPTISVTGTRHVTVEAGFQYNDAHATASDTLDGDLNATDIWTDGDTVDVARDFYTLGSCKQILAVDAAAPTGYYYITLWNLGSQQVRRVWCDMHTVPAGQSSAVGLTYWACDGATNGDCTVAQPYTTAADQQGGCAPWMEMADFTAPYTSATEVAAKGHWAFAATKYWPQAGATSDSYLCAVNDMNDALPAELSSATAIQRHAVVDRYIITYHVADTRGNTETLRHDGTACAGNPSAPRRTVDVTDTLPPVIGLRWNDPTDAKDLYVHVGGHSRDNPAGVKDDSSTFVSANDFLKGETIVDPTSGTVHDVGTLDEATLVHDEAATLAPSSVWYNRTTVSPSTLMAQLGGVSGNAWMAFAGASSVVGVALVAASLRHSKPVVLVEV